MTIRIEKLTVAELDAIDHLMKQNRHTLGFLPKEAIRSHLERGWSLGAKTENNELAGYLLYAAYPDSFRLVHLCVGASLRGQGLAKKLIEKLTDSATTQKIIRLSCRRDFPANEMWPGWGFVPLGERLGRAGLPLVHWARTLVPDDQLSLFQATTSDETLDAVIDAQIFFDFYEPPSDKTNPSQQLCSDSFSDCLSLWITDEMLVEINRHPDLCTRQISRGRAHEFQKAEHNPQLAEHFESVLNQLFPSNTPSNQSDIRQLAKTAASDVKIFVTKDQKILNKKRKINELTNLRVLSPTELILQLHELSEEQSYKPALISGLSLRWSHMNAEALESFPFNNFLNQDERKGQLKEILNSFLSNPYQHKCELLQSGNEIVAIRVLPVSSSKTLTAPLARVARSKDRSLFGRFLIADTISKAIERNASMVRVKPGFLGPSMRSDLLEMGFVEWNDDFVRFCFARCLDRNVVLSEISELAPAIVGKYQEMLDTELEKYCSPLSLNATDQKYFLVPIRSGYAMGLFDMHQSGGDLFGGTINVLLRWSNVYYRSNTRHKMLTSPGRILWYVSQGQQQIVAASHLDAIEIDEPKMLFKKFKKFGILKWGDIYQMCNHNPSQKIMALKFSHTFCFQNPVPLASIRTAFEEDGVVLSLQSALELPPARFQKLFQLGWSGQS